LSRDRELQQYRQLLGQDVAQQLLQELKDTWDPYNLLGDTPERTAYNCGLRDAYKFLEELQSGALIRDE
jgi:hypothetical protein